MSGIACPKCGGFAVWLDDPDTGQDGFLCDSCGSFDCPVCGEWHAERQPPLVLTDEERGAVVEAMEGFYIEGTDPDEACIKAVDAIRSGRGIR